MRFITAADIEAILDFTTLIDALRAGFRERFTIPQRMHLNYLNPEGDGQNTLLLMPAVSIGEVAGVKIVNVSPSNHRKNLATIQGIYYLMDAITGVPLVMMEAKSLTNWRTAAASALAADYLARKQASCLLMVGTGSLAPFVIEAHATVRPLDHLIIYGRTKAKARALAEKYNNVFPNVSVAEKLDNAISAADIISVATLSENPIIHGSMIRPGQHLDLIGSFKPTMREADDRALARSKIFVDSLQTAPVESGDLAIPLANKTITRADIQGDLFQLCQNEVKGRISENEITLFKSVGHALEDLVAARLVLKLSEMGPNLTKN